MSAIEHPEKEADFLLLPRLKYFTFCNTTAVCKEIALSHYIIQYSIYTPIFPIVLSFYKDYKLHFYVSLAYFSLE